MFFLFSLIFYFFDQNFHLFIFIVVKLYQYFYLLNIFISNHSANCTGAKNPAFNAFIQTSITWWTSTELFQTKIEIDVF